jgi:hypothetical protein
MQGQGAERWRELCAQAAVEQDPQRLMELIREINRLLEEKEQRLLVPKPDACVAAQKIFADNGNSTVPNELEKTTLRSRKPR